MGSLVIRVGNSRRQPLQDTMDVRVVSARTDAVIAQVLGVKGSAAVTVNDLPDFQPCIVKVFPSRHRPVAQFATPRPGEPVVVQLYSPVDPERVTDVRFPAYEDLAEDMRRVLDCSTVEGCDGTGEAVYDVLTPTQRAGLFNLYAKMSAFGFDDARTVWTFVDRLYRIRGDRVFADVQPPLRDLVKDAVLADRFHEAPSKLHTPPPGFVHAGSYKTADRYGNLQLTFFAGQGDALAFKVDADIDDAAGLGHTFQVLRNWVTHGTTHPYDIHEILVFRQEVVLPYQLV
jgi:hypothetical protein